MNNELIIKGKFIIGGAGSGKTSELVNLTESLLRENPDWHLLAVGEFDYCEMLSAEIKYDVRHEIFKFSDDNRRVVQSAFLKCLSDICNQSDFDFLIVVDESSFVLSDVDTRCQFVNLIIEANSGSENSKHLHTLISAQSYHRFNDLYSKELIANFAEYTLLRTPNDEPAFVFLGIKTAQIEPGCKYQLTRSDIDNSGGLHTTTDRIIFPAVLDDFGNRFRSIGKFMHFSLLVLPLLVTSFLYYYNAPSLDWIGVRNGEHSFSQQIFELPFIFRALVTAAYYSFAFFLFVYSVNKTIILIKFDFDDVEPIFYFQKELGISVLLALLFSSALIFLNAVLSIVIEVPPYYPIGIN